MAKEIALTISLEELGLSRYEARAYVTLISKGTMSAGDLAFHTEIPRTKIYPTMKKLASKNLAIISNTKSAMVCTAVQPEDAFDAIIHERIQKVEAMNALVAKLKKMGEENRRSGDSKEKRYVQTSAGNVLAQLRTIIEGAESSIMATTDRWGLGLLAECKEQLLTVQRNDVAVRCIIPSDQVCSELHKSLPRGVETRAGHVTGSCIILDGTEVFILDNTDGSGAIFPSAGTLGALQSAAFEENWSGAVRTDVLAEMAAAEAQEICSMIRIVSKEGLSHVLGESMQTGGSMSGPSLCKLLKRSGITHSREKPLDEVLCTFDAIMQITCAGSANLEAGGRSITVESPRNDGRSLPWAAMLDECLQERGYMTKTIHQADSTSGGERTYIQLLSKN